MIPDINNYLQIAEKIMAEVGTIIYFIFALVIIKQVTMMSRNVKDMFNWILIIFSYFHLLLSIGLILIVWFWL